MNTKSRIAIGVSVLAVTLLGAMAWVLLPMPANDVEAAVAPQLDAEQVKDAIAASFAAEPSGFSVLSAAVQLASARLDGFAVCTPEAEATAQQYIEVAAFLDKARTYKAAFQKAVDAVMDKPSGMSDCDFRVLTVIARVAR